MAIGVGKLVGPFAELGDMELISTAEGKGAFIGWVGAIFC